jgi:hypothetical protein
MAAAGQQFSISQSRAAFLSWPALSLAVTQGEKPGVVQVRAERR